jgi:CheY-like chemotaxis protein
MGKILVVDDEKNLLLLLQQIIEDYGHEVELAANGQQALRLIETAPPVLVFSDVMMPVMDGYQLLQSIKARPEWQNIKVVLISAAPINRNFEPHADAYLTKPYDLMTIEDLIDRLAVA